MRSARTVFNATLDNVTNSASRYLTPVDVIKFL